MGIHAACDQYCTSKPIRPSTIKSYKNVVRTFVSNTGITELKQITPERLTEWKHDVEKRSSASTFNNYYRHLSALFNYCVKKKLLAENPLTDVLKFTRVSSRGKTADLSDLKKVCSYLNSLAGTSPGYGAPLRLQHRHHAQGDGESRRQEQVKGLTWSLRERLLKAYAGCLIDTRNWALVAVAYDTLLRRSELVREMVAEQEEVEFHITRLSYQLSQLRTIPTQLRLNTI